MCSSCHNSSRAHCTPVVVIIVSVFFLGWGGEGSSSKRSSNPPAVNPMSVDDDGKYLPVVFTATIDQLTATRTMHDFKVVSEDVFDFAGQIKLIPHVSNVAIWKTRQSTSSVRFGLVTAQILSSCPAKFRDAKRVSLTISHSYTPWSDRFLLLLLPTPSPTSLPQPFLEQYRPGPTVNITGIRSLQVVFLILR